jgi:predicted phage tail protein
MKSILCSVCIFAFCAVLTPTPNSSAQVKSSATLQWQDNSGNEQGFGIEMLSPTDADFTEVGTVDANITQFSLSLSGNYGDVFCFRVYAFNAAGDSPDSNIACKTLPDAPSLPPVTLPSTPNNLHATLASAAVIRLAWDDAQDESQYLLERQLENTTEMQIMLPADQTTFTDHDLEKSRTYCYRLAAVNRIGSSPFTEYVCVDTLPQDNS